MFRRLLYRLTHNIFVNNIAIALRLENRLKSSNTMWKNYKVDSSKSLQENVGFSHRPDVEEALQKAHDDLKKTADTYLKAGSNVLDIGCGTGLYLKDLTGKGFHLYGIDMSEEMVKAAKQHLPEVTYYTGNFMQTEFPVKFDLVYSVSVLEYIARNDLKAHFKKLYDILNPGGVIFIHYPHALNFVDTLYPDLNYIKYAPSVVEKCAASFFEVIEHRHAFDNRKVKNYDPTVYPSQNGTFKNGYLLVARRK